MTVHVLDTSVLIHNPQAVRSFRNTNVAIPIFVVMELDELKNSRRGDSSSSARAASRFIWGLAEYGDLNDPNGILHPELGTRFYIVSNENKITKVSKDTEKYSMDMLILAAALSLREKHERVVLVSKDVNLRIMASFEGIEAEDFESDRVSLSDLFTGVRHVCGEAEVHKAYLEEGVLTPEEIGVKGLYPNEFVVFTDQEHEHLFTFEAEENRIVSVPKDFNSLAGLQPRNIEQRMALSLLLNPEISLVTLLGKAGTGKTFLALTAALAQMSSGKRSGHYDKILLSKPVIAMGPDIGYLPGDMESKMQPWMMSFFDNLDQILPPTKDAAAKGASKPIKSWEYLFQSQQLEIQPIHSIRGRSIPASFMIIDEAQNLTPHEVKTVITRAAEGTKVVLLGDPYQVDHHFLDQHSNGLVYVTEKLKHSPHTGTVFFTKGERSILSELAATYL